MRKNSQEEMVGFVLIVVLVAVISLVFLGFSIKKQSTLEVNSTKVQALIESLMLYTSECVKEEEHLNIKDLIKACYNSERCAERDSCEMLKEELTGLMKQAEASDTSLKNYRFLAYNEQEREIIKIENGNLTGIIYGADFLVPAFPEKIIARLEMS